MATDPAIVTVLSFARIHLAGIDWTKYVMSSKYCQFSPPLSVDLYTIMDTTTQ